MREQCKQRVYSGERWDFGGHRCRRFAVRDGYCNLHLPENVKKRNKALQAKWEKERDNDPLIKAQKRIKELEENFPSLSGLGVREKCPCVISGKAINRAGFEDYVEVPMKDCPTCHGSGYIERDAEWNEVMELVIYSLTIGKIKRFELGKNGNIEFILKSGGRLFLKEEKG